MFRRSEVDRDFTELMLLRHERTRRAVARWRNSRANHWLCCLAAAGVLLAGRSGKTLFVTSELQRCWQMAKQWVCRPACDVTHFDRFRRMVLTGFIVVKLLSTCVCSRFWSTASSFLFSSGNCCARKMWWEREWVCVHETYTARAVLHLESIFHHFHRKFAPDSRCSSSRLLLAKRCT